LLWAAGGLLIYNLDRYLPEASDSVNHPERSGFQKSRLVLIIIAAALLLLTPALMGRPFLYGWLAPALFLSIGYSVALFGSGWRIRDQPWLKWMLPPLIILSALTAPFWLAMGFTYSPPGLVPLLGGMFAALLLNLLLSDAHDSAGDRAHGLTTIAIHLGLRKTRLVALFLISLQFCSAWLRNAPGEWLLAGYHLMIVVRLFVMPEKKLSPWLLDGMLFIPLLGQWVVGQVSL